MKYYDCYIKGITPIIYQDNLLLIIQVLNPVVRGVCIKFDIPYSDENRDLPFLVYKLFFKKYQWSVKNFVRDLSFLISSNGEYLFHFTLGEYFETNLDKYKEWYVFNYEKSMINSDFETHAYRIRMVHRDLKMFFAELAFIDTKELPSHFDYRYVELISYHTSKY